MKMLRQLFKRNMYPFVNTCHNRNSLIIRNFATKKEVEIEDAPIQYTKSMANKWQARSSRIGTQGEERLWYEPYVILGSIGVFLIYFCILREENDLDAELNRTLYSRISGLEEHQLRISLEYQQLHDEDTSAVLKRLKEIEEEKNRL